MSNSSVGVARGILRNTAALFLVGAFAKGMGLVIAIMVARFLGADAMGLFALLFSVAMLIETFISIGMSDSLVRDVAARPGQARRLYLQSLKLVLGISIIPVVALAAAAVLGAGRQAMHSSLLVLAVGAPVSGMFVVSQAAMQGSERVLTLTRVTFLARLLSLVWLLFAFSRGAGVEAAFVSRVLFQAVSVPLFFVVLWRGAAAEPASFTTRTLLTRSAPFALNQALRDLSLRLPSLVLPGTLGLAASGIFDSANRIRGTLGMTTSAAIVGMMPSFARQLAGSEGRSHELLGYSLKYMGLAMALVATSIVVCSEWLVELMFGNSFRDASLPLEILAWAQVLVAIDAVLQQALLASGREYAAVAHSALGVLAQFGLILLLGAVLALPGVALAVLLAATVTLLLDARFAVRSVSTLPVIQVVGAPVAAACLVAAVLFGTRELALPIRALAAAAGWVAAIGLFRLLPREERRFIRQLVSQRDQSGVRNFVKRISRMHAPESLRTRAVVLATQRTGSTFLIDCLNSHPEIECASEILVGDPDRVDLPHPQYPEHIKKIWRLSRVIASGAWRPAARIERFYRDGVAPVRAFKVMYNHLANPFASRYLERNEDICVLHLRRHNLLKVHVSKLLMTKRAEVQSSAPVKPVEVHVDPTDAIKSMREARALSERYDRMFKRHPLLLLNYEDLFDGKYLRADIATTVCDFLGVERHPMTSPIVKLNPESLHAMVTNYDELARAVVRTEFADLLE